MFKFLSFGGKKSEKKQVERETKERPLNKRALTDIL